MADDETEDEDFDYGDSGPDVWLNKDERDLIRKTEKAESDRIKAKEKKLKEERDKAIEPHRHKVLSLKRRAKCSKCGKIGHWRRDCPHKDSFRKKPHTPVSQETESSYQRQSPNYKAMRKARQFLGLAKRVKAAVLESKLCPPFAPHGTTPSWDLSAAFTQTDAQGETTKQTGKERIHCQDIDAIVARKYWSMFSLNSNPNRTRPLRQSADGWGGRETDWVLWELFVHLTIGNGVVSPKPWFVSKWIDEHGMSDKFLLMGGPCSRECIEFLSRTTMTRPEEAVGGMIQLLADRGLEVPSDVAELASQVYETSLPSLGELGELSLHLDGQELEFHLGRLLYMDADERDRWALVTAMSDSALTTDERTTIEEILGFATTELRKIWDEKSQVLTLKYIDEDGAKTTETLDLRNFTASKEVTNKDGEVKHLEWNLDNGDEWWDEERHTPYKMRHIPVALSIMQAMYEKKMHNSEPYAYLGSVLQEEVLLYTSMEFADACEAWASAIGRDRKAWCQY